MIAEKKYIIATTVEEAISHAKAHLGNFKYLSGGTDVMVNRFQGNETSDCLIDLTKIKALKGIEKQNDYLRIGALEILEELKFNQAIKN